MTKEEYMKILENDPDEINLTNEDIIEWLDSIVDALNIATENSYILSWGKLNLDEGEYENSIQPCGSNNYRYIHIYTGIDKLAKAVGCELECNEGWSKEYSYRYFFKYKGVEIFQLEERELHEYQD